MAKRKLHFGQLLWALALAALYFMEPGNNGFSLCLFRLAGFESCWGCGIGHAIHHVLHLEFRQSVQEHLLGLPATVLILYTIFQPIFPLNKQNRLS